MNRYELYTKEQEAHWERNIRRAKFAVREIVYPGVAEPTPPSPNDANNCFLLHVRPVLKISRSLFFFVMLFTDDETKKPTEMETLINSDGNFDRSVILGIQQLHHQFVKEMLS